MKRMLLDNAEYLEQLKDVVENSGLNWKCLDKKSVMVTGAAGMLGSGMVDLLIYLNEHTDLTVNIYALGRTESKLKQRFLAFADKPYFHIITMDISTEMHMEEDVDYITCKCGRYQ